MTIELMLKFIFNISYEHNFSQNNYDNNKYF